MKRWLRKKAARHRAAFEYIVCKQGRAASINDIVHEELEEANIAIGIFMSPLSVHSNLHVNSPHITHNNRAVSRWCGQFRGRDIACYLVQIGGGSVHGIDIDPEVGQRVAQGEIFGMIRVGSQVDLIVPDLPGLSIRVAPGDRVVAGETILIG